MVGNLVDNACKWAQSRVAIEVRASGQTDAAQPVVRIVVDDDGPGLVAGRARAGGARAASGWTRPSPARGSAFRSWSNSPALYGGGLTLGTAPIGGLRAELVLPAG